MGVVGQVKDPVAEGGDPPVDPDRGVARDRRAHAFGPLIAPDFPTGPAAQRVDLVVPGHVHHPVHHDRRRFQSVEGDGIAPLQLQAGGVRQTHLVENAVPVAVQGAVVGRPVALLRMGDLVDGRGRRRRRGRGQRALAHAPQPAQESEQVPLLVRGPVEGGHGRTGDGGHGLVLAFREQVQAPVIGLEHEVVLALAAGESAENTAVIEGDGDEAIAAGGRMGAGLGQRQDQIRGPDPRGNIGKVGADRTPAARGDVAGRALTFTEEIPLPGRGIAPDDRFGVRGVERPDKMRQLLQICRRQREGGHLALALPDDVRDVGFGEAAEMGSVYERGRAVRAVGIVAMAKRANLREHLRGRRQAAALGPGRRRRGGENDRQGEGAPNPGRRREKFALTIFHGKKLELAGRPPARPAAPRRPGAPPGSPDRSRSSRARPPR